MNPAPEIEVRFLGVQEVANRLGVGKDAVFDLCRRGKLQSLRVGRRRVVSAASFEAFVAAGLREQAKAAAAR